MISTSIVLLDIHDALGNPTHPVLSTESNMEYHGSPEIPFINKIDGFLYSFIYRAIYYGYFLPRQDAVARRYLGNDMPYLGEIQSGISLSIVNNNPIIDSVRPHVPNSVMVYQFTTRDPKPLPKVRQIS